MQTTLWRAMVHPVLITRPASGAALLAERLLAELGPDTEILCSPLIRIETLGANLPDLAEVNGLVITSAHAIAPLAKDARARTLPCYCVGGATADAAYSAGLQAIQGGGTAEALLATIKAEKPSGPLLYARGAHITSDLASALSKAGIETHEAILYDQKPVGLTDRAKQLLAGRGTVVLPLFSSRTARLFFNQINPKAALRVAAISATVADAVPKAKAAKLSISPDPTLEAMVTTISALASDT